jgi:hypothetical protein
MSQAATAWAELAEMLTPPGIKYRPRNDRWAKKFQTGAKYFCTLFRVAGPVETVENVPK